MGHMGLDAAEPGVNVCEPRLNCRNCLKNKCLSRGSLGHWGRGERRYALEAPRRYALEARLLCANVLANVLEEQALRGGRCFIGFG